MSDQNATDHAMGDAAAQVFADATKMMGASGEVMIAEDVANGLDGPGEVEVAFQSLSLIHI